MGSQQKDIEMSPVKLEASLSVAADVLNAPVTDEEDVIIGRFRKISSAKSMAATNGNIQYPTDMPTKCEDIEAGIQFRMKDTGERDRLLPENTLNGQGIIMTNSPNVGKSSFRDVEKPSRFKDQPSATRFQVRN